jgi:hypothetical protein
MYLTWLLNKKVTQQIYKGKIVSYPDQLSSVSFKPLAFNPIGSAILSSPPIPLCGKSSDIK